MRTPQIWLCKEPYHTHEVHEDEMLEEGEKKLCPEHKRQLEQVCEYCWGNGEVLVDAPVYPDEGSPRAPIDTDVCDCQLKERDDEDDNRHDR